MVGSTVNGCNDFMVVSWMNGAGATCDEVAVDEVTTSSNALMSDKGLLNNPFKALEELDPFIRHSLIGIMVTFIACLLFMACYVCIGNIGKLKVKGEIDYTGDDDSVDAIVEAIAAFEKSDRAQIISKESDGEDTEMVFIR
eukprot:UN12170